MTKTRSLIEEVCTPLMDRIDAHKMQISKLCRSEQEKEERIALLEDIIVHKNEKNNAFEKIHDLIASGEQ